MLKLRNQIFQTIKKKRPNYIKYNYPVLLLHFFRKKRSTTITQTPALMQPLQRIIYALN